jgi:spore coat polysaccharide biosynthesis protein SpsF
MNSSRLPGKVILPFAGSSIIECIHERVKRSKRVNDVLVGTSIESSDNSLVKLLEEKNINYFRGSLDNVLNRFASISKEYNPDFLVRITGDCPLIDPDIIDICVENCVAGKYDYFRLLEPYPDGLDVDIFKSSAITIANEKAKKISEREHIGQYFLNNPNDFLLGGINLFETRHQEIRITLDEEEDYKLLKELEKNLDDIQSIKYEKLLSYILDNKSLLLINKNIIRNEGLKKSQAKE